MGSPKSMPKPSPSPANQAASRPKASGPPPTTGGDKKPMVKQPGRIQRQCVPYTLPSGCHLGANCPFLHENDPVTSKPKAPMPEDLERYQRARKGGQNAGGQKQQTSGQPTSSQGKPIQLPTVKTIKAPIKKEVTPRIHMIRRARGERPQPDPAESCMASNRGTGYND